MNSFARNNAFGQRIVSSVNRTIPVAAGPFSTAFTVSQLLTGLGITPTTSPRTVQFQSFEVEIVTTGSLVGATPQVQVGLFEYNNATLIPITAGVAMSRVNPTRFRVTVPTLLKHFYQSNSTNNVIAVMFSGGFVAADDLNVIINSVFRLSNNGSITV